MDGGDLVERYAAAENLTDRLAALRLLVHYGLDGAEDALDRFHARYRDNPLVLDKWFAVQATAPSHAALDRVEALSAHPAFSFKNPNRVYALIRSFAAFNPVGFNRPDGAGYRFVGERDRRPRRAEPVGRRAHRDRLPLVAHARAEAARPGRERAAEDAAVGAPVARPRRHPDPHAGRLKSPQPSESRPSTEIFEKRL